MFFNFAAVAILSALSANAATHTVKVGDGGLAFNPTNITGVKAGDDVQFVFQGKNHTVTQSSFASPCTALDGGVNSGFVNVTAGGDPNTLPTWSFTVNNETTPLWFYCRQKTPVSHCAMGMVFSINPTADKSHEKFLAAAKATNSTAGGASGSAGAGGAAASATGSSSGSSGASNASPSAAAALGNSSQPNGARALVTGGAATVLAVVGVLSSIL